MPDPPPAQGEAPSLFDATNDATRNGNSPAIGESDQEVRPQRELRPITFPDGSLWQGTTGLTDDMETITVDQWPQGSRPIAPKPGRATRLRARQRKSPEPSQLRLDDVTWLVANVRDMLAKQNQVMEAIRAGQKTLKEQNDGIRKQNDLLQAQNDELKAETETLRRDLDGLRNELKARETTRPTWATVAAQGNGEVAGTPSSTSHASTPRPIQHHLPGINLDLACLASPQFDSSDVKAVRERVRQAFDSHDDTKAIGWIGVARRGSDHSKVRICLRTEKEAALARNHDGWLHSHLRGARMQGEQWYPVKVDRVNKNSVCDESLVRLREDACLKLSAENSISIRKMRFIGRPNPDKLYCSVVLYLASKPEAEKLLSRKYIDVDGEVAYTRVFEPSVGPRRCFRCHQFDSHEARRCPAQEPTCGLCASVGHSERECVSDTLRCANCFGPHRASDRGCPVYKRLLQGANLTRYAPES